MAIMKEKQNSTLLRKFIAHNQKIFKNDKQKTKRKSLVLLEMNTMNSAYIAYSYLANVLAENHKAQINAYVMYPQRSWREKLLFKMRSAIGSNIFGIYKSFGVTNFIYISITSAQKSRAKKLFAEIYNGLKNKKDIETITINGVLIGDLIYDSFLVKHKKPTIDMECLEFEHFLLESIELFIFWEDFFNDNDVRAINVSHCVYNLALPLRLAVSRNISAFQANVTHIYRLNKENLHAYTDFRYFRERFKTLPEAVKVAGIAEARQRLKRRFAGEVGVDMDYSTKSAYVSSNHARLLRESSRKKILIATHCFFDSPHCYGGIIFPDHYEWLDFLGKISELTDYDWYIKTHPDYRQGNMEIIDSFLAKYPKFVLLPADASHHQIISEGIDFALTVHGTIGFEYAALGIPVINVSLNNPHVAYDFNLHAKDIDDYRRMLLELDKVDFEIDTQQVYEYYYMRYIYNTEDMFFDSYAETINRLGGYREQFTPAIYEKWMDEWNFEKHGSIMSAIASYVESGDFRMDYKHFCREVPVCSIKRC